MSRILRFCAAVVCATLIAGSPGAQTPAPSDAPPPPSYSQDQLDMLLAPVALYPDSLLMQVLIASTYPLEVTSAARFVAQNPGLSGPALDTALASRNWDPSVLALTAFPQVLAMMDDRLEWTQQLGDAFLADEPRVMTTVQTLRARAQAAGNLQSSPQQSVVVRERAIVIEPAQPGIVYVPYYDPVIVYGPWWAPAYRPWHWVPPPYYGYPTAAIATSVVFGIGLAIAVDRWNWARPDWRARHVNINASNYYYSSRPQYRDHYASGIWTHQAEHRLGVAYRDPALRDRYQRIDPHAVQSRNEFRGHELTRPAPQSSPYGATQRGETRPPQSSRDKGDAGPARPGYNPRPETAPSAMTPAQGSRPEGRPSGAPAASPPQANRPAASPQQTAPRQDARQSSPAAQQSAPQRAEGRGGAAINSNQNRAQAQSSAVRGRESIQSMNRDASPPPEKAKGERERGKGEGQRPAEGQRPSRER